MKHVIVLTVDDLTPESYTSSNARLVEVAPTMAAWPHFPLAGVDVKPLPFAASRR